MDHNVYNHLKFDKEVYYLESDDDKRKVVFDLVHFLNMDDRQNNIICKLNGSDEILSDLTLLSNIVKIKYPSFLLSLSREHGVPLLRLNYSQELDCNNCGDITDDLLRKLLTFSGNCRFSEILLTCVNAGFYEYRPIIESNCIDNKISYKFILEYKPCGFGKNTFYLEFDQENRLSELLEILCVL